MPDIQHSFLFSLKVDQTSEMANTFAARILSSLFSRREDLRPNDDALQNAYKVWKTHTTDRNLETKRVLRKEFSTSHFRERLAGVLQATHSSYTIVRVAFEYFNNLSAAQQQSACAVADLDSIVGAESAVIAALIDSPLDRLSVFDSHIRAYLAPEFITWVKLLDEAVKKEKARAEELKGLKKKHRAESDVLNAVTMLRSMGYTVHSPENVSENFTL